MIRQSRFGVAGYNLPALERFPPPEFLTDTQRNLWIAALGDVPLEFFRARHIPIMIQYVRAVETMMELSDQLAEDSSDPVIFSRWEKMLRITMRVENHLSMNTEALISMVTRARSELRVANQQKSAREAGESAAAPRAGLVYVGH
jgi:hypothetical protein